MTVQGISRRFIIIVGPYLLFTVVISFVFKRFFSFIESFNGFIFFMGFVFFVIGLGLFLTSGLQLYKAFNEKKLETKGMYSLCRNPMYASVIFIIIPGFSLMVNSWFVLTSSVLMYLLFVLYYDEEDEYLERKFGEEFLKYKKETGLLLPKLSK